MGKLSSLMKTDFEKKRIDAHRINRKADIKLNAVADGFRKTLGDRCIEVKDELLRKTIVCSGFKYLTSFELNYRAYENRFWAFSYNLDVTAKIDVSDREYMETEHCLYKSKTKGKMAINDVEWLGARNGCSEEEDDIYVRKLNHQLIRNRMVNLDMVSASMEYDPEKMIWTLKFRTMIGSTTWMLIPPLTQLVVPRPEEFAQMTEFMDLAMGAVLSKEMREYKKAKSKSE